ncbi:uncharacterized protein EI90DRAFT_3126494 [Cantharellus anzutake]|uniref:uncharacterized protein n=1 Tax=Cantharellus anzutake TaxID=1750568 RepID=UPI00190589E6|nr:uncharacterized protein EI90DRAFT_3126494 [Cantharellus anzutake]KAF8327872.1 hypothetical protein EI90DRAFT_3126494 [Cantharellus anzutake]
MTTQSPLSEFEELGIGSSTWLPGTPQVSSSEVGPPPDRGWALTAEEGFNLRPHPLMSLEEQILELTRQLQDLQTQLATQRQPAPPPAAAPAPTRKPPKVATPTPFSRSQDDLDRFKAECRLYMSMHHAEFPDEYSQVLFILSYMKGGAAGPWATQRINSLLAPGAPRIAFDDFTQELDSMFADPNHQATAWQKLASLRQGSKLVDKLIQQFELHGPVSRMGDVALCQNPCSMIRDPTQPDKPGSLIVASRKTSFLLSFPLAAQLEPVSPSTPRSSPIETDPDLPSLTSTSTGSLDLSSEQLGILTPWWTVSSRPSTHTSERASTTSTRCLQPGPNGSMRPPSLTTSGNVSKPPNLTPWWQNPPHSSLAPPLVRDMSGVEGVRMYHPAERPSQGVNWACVLSVGALQEEGSRTPSQLAPEDLRAIIDSLRGHHAVEAPPPELEKIQ